MRFLRNQIPASYKKREVQVGFCFCGKNWMRDSLCWKFDPQINPPTSKIILFKSQSNRNKLFDTRRKSQKPIVTSRLLPPNLFQFCGLGWHQNNLRPGKPGK